MKTFQWVFTVVAGIALTACGGSGSSNPRPTPTSVPTLTPTSTSTPTPTMVSTPTPTSTPLTPTPSPTTIAVDLSPADIGGKSIVHTIEQTNGQGSQWQGAVYRTSYFSDGFFYEEALNDIAFDGDGTYRYNKTAEDTATEMSLMRTTSIGLENFPFNTDFTFTSETAGIWSQNVANGLILFDGTFTLEDIPAQILDRVAPAVLVDVDIAMTITGATDAVDQGLLVRQQAADTFNERLYGTVSEQTIGTNTWLKSAYNTLTDTATVDGVEWQTQYIFTSPDSGTWHRAVGSATQEGNFSVTQSGAAVIALEVIEGYTFTYTPAGGQAFSLTYMTGGVFNNDMPGINGTYDYQRVTANTAIEQGVVTSDGDKPYTTIYTFETDTTGRWYQNYNNGENSVEGRFEVQMN